jgi:exodeoxyribonuclease VII small subunit
MEKETKYEAAYAELQGIVRKMEGEELDIDQMAEAVKRAQALIKVCKDKLTKTDAEIKKILADTSILP